MPRLRMLNPLIRPVDTNTTRVAPKRASPVYLSAQHKQWRAAVMQRAGFRCEALVNGSRCDRAEPLHKIYADHRTELRDGGGYDVANGMALCARCHQIKTMTERANRLKS